VTGTCRFTRIGVLSGEVLSVKREGNQKGVLAGPYSLSYSLSLIEVPKALAVRQVGDEEYEGDRCARLLPALTPNLTPYLFSRFGGVMGSKKMSRKEIDGR
jgi:hypothetical protein